MTGTKQTACELYDERRQDIARLLKRIEGELDVHKAGAKTHPTDWSYPGALGHVREKLVETLAFLSDSEPQDIENLLTKRR